MELVIRLHKRHGHHLSAGMPLASSLVASVPAFDSGQGRHTGPPFHHPFPCQPWTDLLFWLKSLDAFARIKGGTLPTPFPDWVSRTAGTGQSAEQG
jgi:hypothetical protein